MIVAIHHVQLAMPKGAEEEAVAFYEAILGIPHVPKPPRLADRGGCWFESASVKVHLGVDQDFLAARKAHPALLVDDLAQLADALTAAGYALNLDEPLDGYERVYVDDPFGNRIELLQQQA